MRPKVRVRPTGYEISEVGLSNDPEEVEANFFALELLMPTEMIKQDWERIKKIDFMDDKDLILKELATKYRVGKTIFALRCAMIWR